MTTATTEGLSTLYKRATTGATQEWTIDVIAGDDPFGPATIVTRYGQVGGALQTTEDVVTEGKNVGRANETTPWEQARAEARAKWEKKLKNGGYARTQEEAEAGQQDSEFVAGGVKPMLAHDYSKRGHDIRFPALVQPKLDGHRCIAVVAPSGTTLWSRNQKPITSMTHVQAALDAQFAGYFAEGGAPVVLDGELYRHDESFQKLSGMIRKATPQPGSDAIQYWIYDTASDRPQHERVAIVGALATDGPIVVVPTEEAADNEEMVAIFGAYLAQNYEGLMVRNRDAKYKNARSADLQKVKVFDDAEYEVMGVETGRGKMAGLAIFRCYVDETKTETFTVKMKGSLDSLRQYVEDPSLAIGRQLTVQYQGVSDDGVPRFPVGLRFREEI